MAKKDDKGRWIDPIGNPIPVKYVDKTAKLRDQMIERHVRQALLIYDRLYKFKVNVRADLAKYLDWLATSHGEDALNPGGNYILPGFSGDKRLCIKVHKLIDFDERLHLAKQKIDRCLEKWSEGADDNLKAVVYRAFEVNEKGKLDAKSILHLRTVKIKDKEWQSAMELIADAILISGSKTYFHFQQRDKEGAWKTIRLNLASV